MADRFTGEWRPGDLVEARLERWTPTTILGVEATFQGLLYRVAHSAFLLKPEDIRARSVQRSTWTRRVTTGDARQRVLAQLKWA